MINFFLVNGDEAIEWWSAAVSYYHHANYTIHQFDSTFVLKNMMIRKENNIISSDKFYMLKFGVYFELRVIVVTNKKVSFQMQYKFETSSSRLM